MVEFYSGLSQIILNAVLAIIGLCVSSIVIPWIRNTAIPWLKEKRLYNLCMSFVMAAEKMAESGQITKDAKKNYVISLLRSKGIEVTPEIEAMIECAVKELDMMVDEVIREFE